MENIDLCLIEELITREEVKEYLTQTDFNATGKQIEKLKNQYKFMNSKNNELTLE